MIQREYYQPTFSAGIHWAKPDWPSTGFAELPA
jgi:hypothetical protein